MNRLRITRISAILPIFMSFAAFLLGLAGGIFGWGDGRRDEGAAAHIFQLLIVLQIPIIVTYLATADWKRSAQIVWTLVVHILGIALAFGPVAYFKL